MYASTSMDITHGCITMEHSRTCTRLILANIKK